MARLIPLALLLLALYSACGGSKAASKEPPKWVTEMIDSFENKVKHSVGASISKYAFDGDIVYYVLMPCCDQFNELYSESGDLLCYPDGGITGKGDGKCPEFDSGAELLETIWEANAR